MTRISRWIVLVLILPILPLGIAMPVNAQQEPTDNNDTYLDTDNYMSCQIVEDTVWESILKDQEPFSYVVCVEVPEEIHLTQNQLTWLCQESDDVEWCIEQVEYEPGLSYLFIPKDELIIRAEAHSHFVTANLTFIPEVERWRPLVTIYFQPEHVNRELRLIYCESTGNPEAANPNSTARGLTQHLESLWAKRSVDAGWAGADIFDPEANIAVAAWLVYHGGGWGHWNASKWCWGWVS